MAANPLILWPLLPLEEAVRDRWTVRRAPSAGTSANVQTLSNVGAKNSKGEITKVTQLFETVRRDIAKEGHTLVKKITHTSETSTSAVATSGTTNPRSHEHRVARAVKESSMGALVREIFTKWEDD